MQTDATICFCRDCFVSIKNQAIECAHCGSNRLIHHQELDRLFIAHLDCDAFYAAVEKRDNPTIREKPVIIGGGDRGVVATACYIARSFGIHSAMPMYKAKSLCPDAIILTPNIVKYREVSRSIMQIFETATPLVERVSLDEAYLDLTGTRQIHREASAITLARLIKTIENTVGITISLGLSHNKFLAKMASDENKPSGFSIVGYNETSTYLYQKKISKLPGVGPSLVKRCNLVGIEYIKDVLQLTEDNKNLLFGKNRVRMEAMCNGHDSRKVTPKKPVKSLSTETTFTANIGNLDLLLNELWPLCEKVSCRLKLHKFGAFTITVKLTTPQFKKISRSITLNNSTQLAEVLYKQATRIVTKQIRSGPFRLIGISVKNFQAESLADLEGLFDSKLKRVKSIEKVLTDLKKKFGNSVIEHGRSFKR